MRAIVTGQVGMDKKAYLDAVVRRGAEMGRRIAVHHVGDMMYAEAPDLRPGRILDLPLSRLNALRRAVLKDVMAASVDEKDVIINTHATFRWRHGLFSAFDFDQIRALRPDMFICLVDNIEVVFHRLHREHEVDASFKDCMVWREEEILATELMAQATMGGGGSGGGRNFYILARGRHKETTETCLRLVTRPEMRKVYPSFPMSHVVDRPDVLAEIDHFRAELAKHFITFDPGDVDEKLLLDRAIEAARAGRDFVEIEAKAFGGRGGGSGATSGGGNQLKGQAATEEQPVRIPVREIVSVAGDVDGQIYMRDFKLIDQSDMICSYIPELPGGIPGLSSGVERELQHAFEHTKEVYVVWRPKKNPSPFITETATGIFRTTEEAMEHFGSKGMLATGDLFGD